MTDEIAAVTPKEIYHFTYGHEDAVLALRRQRTPYIRSLIIAAIVAALFFFLFISEDFAATLAVSVFLVMAIPHIMILSRLKKSWEKSYHRLTSSSYDFEIFDYYLIVTVSRFGEIFSTSKIFLVDISKIETDGAYLIITVGNQLYTLRRSDIPEASILLKPLGSSAPPKMHAPAAENSADVEPPPAAEPAPAPAQKLPKVPRSGDWNFASWLLFAGSFIAVVVADKVSSAFDVYVAASVCILLFLIPTASLVVGIIMKKKGLKGTKNIVIGIIMIICMLLYIVSAFAGQYILSADSEELEDPTPIYNAEELLNIDIPEHEYIHTSSSGTDLNSTFVYYSSYVQFSEYDADMLMLKVPNDSRWNSTVPTALIGISSPYERTYSSPDSYTLIYNIDTGEYNKLPDEDGTYRFMSLIFEPQQDSLTIIEYDIDYVACK